MVFDIEVSGRNYKAYQAAVENNDFSKIVDLLRDSEVKIEKHVRELIAAKLDCSFKGKPGPSANSAATKDKILHGYQCYLWLTIIEKCPKDAAKERVAEVMGVSKKSVNNWFSKMETWSGMLRLGAHTLRPFFEALRDEPDLDLSLYKPDIL